LIKVHTIKINIQIFNTLKVYLSPFVSLCVMNFHFFLSGSLVVRIHLIRWINGVFGVRTPTPAYNNALSYQLSYAHGWAMPTGHVLWILLRIRCKWLSCYIFIIIGTNLYIIMLIHFLIFWICRCPDIVSKATKQVSGTLHFNLKLNF